MSPVRGRYETLGVEGRAAWSGEGTAKTVVSQSSGGWSKKLKIPKFQVAVFRGVANHVLPLVRRFVDYRLLTNPAWNLRADVS